MKSKKTTTVTQNIYGEYLAYQEKYEKKYGKKNTLVLMQIGSFYELYSTKTRGFDLTIISSLLNIALTRKDKSNDIIDEKNPYMMGFTCPALHKYLNKLISAGFTVVIIDQVTPKPDPKREVTGIYSPGTYLEEMVSMDSNNIVSLFIEDELQLNGQVLQCVGMTYIDLSTGECGVHEAYAKNIDDKFALDEALRFININQPKEIIIYHKQLLEKEKEKTTAKIMDKNNIISYLELDGKKIHYKTEISKNLSKLSYTNEYLAKIYKNKGILSSVEYLNLEKYLYATISFMILLDFAYGHDQNIINELKKPKILPDNKNLTLGNNAVFQLNVIDNNSDSDTGNTIFKSLFHVVNKTSTAMGKRNLKKILTNPIISSQKLQLKYNCIENILQNNTYIKIEDKLKGICDMERGVRRLSLKRIHPYEIVNLFNACNEAIGILNILKNKKEFKKLIPEKKIVGQLLAFITDFEKTFIPTIMEKYQLTGTYESYFVKGIYPTIDKIQVEMDEATVLLDNICEIFDKYIDGKGTKKSSLKIALKHNDKEGHYLLLTKIRAESLKKNLKDITEIKITNALKIDPVNLEYKDLPSGKQTKILFPQLKNKSKNVKDLETQLTNEIFENTLKEYTRIYAKYGNMLNIVTEFVAEIDVLKSSAKVAKLYNYCKPTISVSDNGFIRCKQLRHAIIERIRTECEYVPHDISLGNSGKKNDDSIDGMLVYGLNSSGKSSLMKAIGLSVIMAQAGMYVPASEYNYSPYTSLFARITGNDNIFKGLSSFTLEMTELRAILARTGPKTLVIGDEVCRGTEHVSGISIVTATLINLAKTGSTFIFATHLHQIAEMNRIKELKNIASYHLTVDYDKEKDQLIFDRILKPGPGEQVYGYIVAKYIIQDTEFMGLVQDIKNELTDTPDKLIGTKTSKYNSKVYVTKCQVCNKKNKSKKNMGFFDTHHINNQKDCKDGFVVNKPHLPMNNKSNLVILCKECHYDVHHDKLEIKGYTDTSNGPKLNYKTLQS